ncbi:MAG: hypothetical protein ACOWYE_12265 [Desulfatiglandales bacterium]
MKKLFVVIACAAVVVGMILPAVAADKEVNLYGSVRFMTYWQDKDKENAPGGLHSDGDLTWDMDLGCSRFGAIFKSGDIQAHVEIRPRDRDNGYGDSFGGYYNNETVRLWNASWNFGAGTLIIGQAYTPTFNPVSNECMLGGGGWFDGAGDMGFSVRERGIQVHFPIPAANGKLELALLRNQATVGNIINDTADYIVTGAGDTDVTLPKIEARFSFATGPFSAAIFGGYNTFSEVNTTTDKEYDIDSYVIGAKFDLSLGRAFLKAGAWTGQNVENYGVGAPRASVYGGAVGDARYIAATDSIEDVEHFGWVAALGYKFTDIISAELSYGENYREADNALGTEDEDDNTAWVLIVPIQVAKGFQVIPQVVFEDRKDKKIDNVTTEEGERWYYGAYWQIDF